MSQTSYCDVDDADVDSADNIVGFYVDSEATGKMVHVCQAHAETLPTVPGDRSSVPASATQGWSHQP